MVSLSLINKVDRKFKNKILQILRFFVATFSDIVVMYITGIIST